MIADPGLPPALDCIRRTTCRLCGSERLSTVLSLTPTPLAAAMPPFEPGRFSIGVRCYPLDLGRCSACGHVQLLDAVDRMAVAARPIEPFGRSTQMVRHLGGYAEALLTRVGHRPDALIVDVGANDGTFLKVFEDRGWRVQGFESVIPCAGAAIARGIPTFPGFLAPPIAERIEETRGRATIVSLHQAFAEAADPHVLLHAIEILLSREGLLAFEVSYLGGLVEQCGFDGITHKDLDYHTLGPLHRFLASHGFDLVAVERTGIHRGSLRGLAQRFGGPLASDGSVAALLDYERALGLDSGEAVHTLPARIAALRDDLTGRLRDLRAAGQTIAGYGATFGATTLCYEYGIDADLMDFVVDDTPCKQGLSLPGLGIPILSDDAIKARRPDWIVILCWNYADAVIGRLGDFRERGGRILVPLPKVVAL